MIHNPILHTSLDFVHLMATIAWIGGMVFNFLVVMPTVSKTLEPATAAKFMTALMRRVRVVVYVSLAVLFITGIPMKIANENYVWIISFENSWQIAGFIKHVFVAFLALLALYSFEILTPKLARLAQAGKMDEVGKLRIFQKKLAAVSFLMGIIIVLLSAMMNYL